MMVRWPVRRSSCARAVSRGQLVGGTTFGKGIIQGVFGLSDGGALIETVASYATPSREEINLKGIKVDEKKTFVSDVLGSGFVTADVKAAEIKGPDIKTCTLNAGAPPNPALKAPADP